MNFEVFSTQEDLDARVMALMGVAIEMISDYNGHTFTLKWR